jgi:hypothetical protein
MRAVPSSPMLPESGKSETRKAVMTNLTQTGIVVSTAITAGPGSGAGGVWLNHAEGIVVSSAISAGGSQLQHAEGIVVSTAITAGPGSGAGGVWLNHTEGIVRR